MNDDPGEHIIDLGDALAQSNRRPQPSLRFQRMVMEAENDTPPTCWLCKDGRPRHRLGRFRHRLWIAKCGHAWRTERVSGYEATIYVWRRWP